MDTTMPTALKIISDKTVSDWRKRYWIQRVTDEISGFRLVKLDSQANLLEKQLNVAVTSSKVQ